MVRCTVCLLVVLGVNTVASAEGIVARAEANALRRADGTVTPRVVRDQDGQVTRLLLTDMKLAPEDLEEISSLEQLRALVLFRTNVTDRDLEPLRRCAKLDHLNLTSTEVTDKAIDSILKMEKLKSLCLGDVNISADAMEKLKERNRSRDRSDAPYLRWGYSQRKEPAEK